MGSRGVANMILSRASRMKAKLQSSLEASLLEIEDVSHQHAGHAAMKGNTAGETHFNVKIVSPKFDGLNLVKRHRLVYDALAEELQSGLHALSIVAKTPQEEGAAAKNCLSILRLETCPKIRKCNLAIAQDTSDNYTFQGYGG
ncbi:hypothetical protein POTOM_042828 [Populus tomentosa]|uniref:Uncharacterized protein n=1 Tax=Populus tomentosa TaxID=118781 RepID=A0A8X7YMX7_POPTO|nr:hypothetical protein POTOM_042828 [Populus tomentosa]